MITARQGSVKIENCILSVEINVTRIPVHKWVLEENRNDEV